MTIINTNDAVIQQLSLQAPSCFVPVIISQTEVSDRSFCSHSTVFPQQPHTSHSKHLTTLPALSLRSRYPTLDLSRKAACSPPGVNYNTFFSPHSLGRTWKCINLDSSLQSKGSFEETPVVSPKGEVTQQEDKGRRRGKERVIVYSLLTTGRWLLRNASQSFTLYHLYSQDVNLDGYYAEMQEDTPSDHLPAVLLPD